MNVAGVDIMLGTAAIFNNLPALLVVAPLLLAPISALVALPSVGWVLAVTGSGFSFVAALLLQSVTESGLRITYYLGNWPPPWGIEFVVDSATSFTLVVMSTLAFLATLAARRLVQDEISEKDIGKFYAAWLLVCGGLFGLVMTADAFNLFVFLEISALSSVILISMGAGTDRRALVAGYNYLVIGAVGATFYVIGVGFVYALTGTLNMGDLASRIPNGSSDMVLYVGFGFMVAGMLVKAAVFPVHIWLPAAYSYAPSAVSTLLAAIATKAALYVLARIAFTIFVGVPDLVEMALQSILVPLAVAGIFVGTIMAIYEADIKKLFAYSSVAQIGYIALGFGLATPAGVGAGFIHIGNHALIKGGIFMAIGSFVVALGSRANLDRFVGIGRRMPITATAFLICGLSLAGLPLTAGFVSKLFLVRAILESESYIILALVLISSALSVIYLWKIFEVMWMQPAPPKSPHILENPAIYLPIWFVALANIWFGIDAEWMVDAARLAATALVGGGA
jgi:multicomponent Na+:H+ antiporter subunit D